MKKYIFTETQIKRVIDSVIEEQTSGFDYVYNNPPISQQMKKFPGAKFGFSPSKIKELDSIHSNKLYKVEKGDTVSGIVEKLGANSIDSIYYDNDLLKKNDPNTLQKDMVICVSLLPSGA